MTALTDNKKCLSNLQMRKVSQSAWHHALSTVPPFLPPHPPVNPTLPLPLPPPPPASCSTHTACSSSLVATHLAHTGLLNGEARAAASCGIFMVLLPGTMSGISQLQVGGLEWAGLDTNMMDQSRLCVRHTGYASALSSLGLLCFVKRLLLQCKAQPLLYVFPRLPAGAVP